MLQGPSSRPHLPEPPKQEEGLKGIVRYLRDLDEELQTHLSAIVQTTVGMLGVRGVSSSGVPARNFVKQSLAIGNQTTAMWIFTNIEANPSYMIFYSPSASTGMVMTNQQRTTTGVLFTFNPAVPSGLLLDIMLAR